MASLPVPNRRKIRGCYLPDSPQRVNGYSDFNENSIAIRVPGGNLVYPPVNTEVPSREKRSRED
jgi:hypothetical protein